MVTDLDTLTEEVDASSYKIEDAIPRDGYKKLASKLQQRGICWNCH